MILGVKKTIHSFKKGQNLTEVALIIGVVGLVLVGMQTYVTRGVQGKLKGITDHMIGTEQSAYQQDVSGYSVNISGSTISQDSTTVLTQQKGGGKRTVGTEIILSTSGYESKE
ncbi:MAG: hypothetical protein WAQ07_00105 [Candidatus Omnitrophota bacterium]